MPCLTAALQRLDMLVVQDPCVGYPGGYSSLQRSFYTARPDISSLQHSLQHRLPPPSAFSGHRNIHSRPAHTGTLPRGGRPHYRGDKDFLMASQATSAGPESNI